MFLTIFTPAYNRAHLLPRLYKSLKAQTLKDFEWVIVDDGSTDDTEPLIRGYMASETSFPIRYAKQPNGGKHRAFNRGVEMAEGVWFKCLDSDDWLFSDAVERLKPYCDELESDDDFCSVTCLRTYRDGTVIGTPCNYTVLDTDFFSYRNRLHIVGDRSEIVKVAIWKEFPFPEFDGENFLSEGGTMTQMARKYKTRYVNLPFQYCEYQPGGLTDTAEKKYADNPIGMMFMFLQMFLHPAATFKQRLIFAHNHRKYEKIATNRNIEIPEISRKTSAMKAIHPLVGLLDIYLKLRLPKNGTQR